MVTTFALPSKTLFLKALLGPVSYMNHSQVFTVKGGVYSLFKSHHHVKGVDDYPWLLVKGCIQNHLSWGYIYTGCFFVLVCVSKLANWPFLLWVGLGWVF